MPAKKLSAVALALGVAFNLIPYANAEVQDSDQHSPAYFQLERLQVEKNSKEGKRYVPERSIPIPSTVSLRVQELTAQPYPAPKWNANHPQTEADWKKVVDPATAATLKSLPDLRKKLSVTSKSIIIGGVPAFEVAPASLPEENKNRILLHIHGGGFIYNPGEAGTLEAVLMAAYGGYKVISVDYRLAPMHAFPAALDDVVNAYKEVITQYGPNKTAVFGSSAGGNLTLALMLRAKAEGLPLPAAIAPSTPWSDLTRTGGGDTMETLEWIDGNLVSYNGYISYAAKAYAKGHSMSDPYISPIKGDFHNLPPSILTSGTRDLFLSLTAMTHRKLKQAGVDARLEVYEGMAHAQYFDPWAPESKEVFADIGHFFNSYLEQ